MRKYKIAARNVCLAMALAALAALGMASTASAHTGRWAAFNNCPASNASAFKCVSSVTHGGKVVLGKKTVPIVNPVTLQGGLTEAEENEAGERFSHMIAATNGETLSKTPQPVPGGLAGLVNCKEISNFLVRLGCETVFENGLTGVNATLELAKPASEVLISQNDLVFEEGVALKLPVKIRLENPLFGSNCYVGSNSAPLMWNLTTGATTPPAGTAPLHGIGGNIEFYEEDQIAEVTGSQLVDNAWAAPHANGCGGPIVELIIDPIVDASIGLPAAAGTNVAQLSSVTTDIALAEEVRNH